MANTVHPNFHGKKGVSGRRIKPSTLINRALESLDKRLPEIFEALVEQALDGDREAQIYLIDRRLGKPKQTQTIEDAGDIGLNVIVGLLRAYRAQERLEVVEEARQLMQAGSIEVKVEEYEPGV